MNPRIGVFDSGVGGLSIWREIVRTLPAEPLLYLADQAHVPYGSRDLDEILRFADGIVRFFRDRGVSIVVLACNTASAAALHPLRERFPDLAFVGMEPAVKPAAEESHTRKVAVIATEATFQGRLFASVVERFAEGVEVFRQPCPGLADRIERGDLDSEELRSVLHGWLDPLVAQGIDRLVLACTHYPLIRAAIEDVVGPGVTVIDPAPAVARQVRRVLLERFPRAAPAEAKPGRTEFLTTGGASAFAVQLQCLGIRADGVRACRWRPDGKEIQS